MVSSKNNSIIFSNYSTEILTAVYYSVTTANRVLRVGQYSTTEIDFSTALDIVITEGSEEKYSDFLVEVTAEQSSSAVR